MIVIIITVINSLLLVLNTGSATTTSLKPNVCKKYADYFYMDNNPDCWYNPDVDMSVTEWIINKGYPLETYKIKSEDGYITGLFRMPRAKPNKGTVYLLHSALTTMAVWLNKGVNDSLGFLLHDAGYDVWMGNSRGTVYSDEHVWMSSKSPRYWDFSFHEMAMHDLPKHLELIKNVTNGDRAVFVGSSMGSTIGYVYAAMMPEHADAHLRTLVLATSGGLFDKVKTPLLHSSARYVNLLHSVLKSFNYVKVPSEDDQISIYVSNFCRNYAIGLNLCPYLVRPILGINNVDRSAAWTPVSLSQSLKGTVPIKAMVHFGQWIGFDDLQYRMFDYGPSQNRRVYKSTIPPKYPISKIKTPVLLIGGTNDWLTTIEGMDAFYNELSPEAKIHGKMIIPEYNHDDMFVASDCAEVVYKPLLKFIDSLNANN